MIKSAKFSEDRSKRFELIRDWRDEMSGPPLPTALFIGLNPSKAGEEVDDMTIRKEIGFAKRWGYGRIVAVNLIATVSTDPWELPHWSGEDRQNMITIMEAFNKADLIVAAWGSVPNGIIRKVGLSERIHLLSAMRNRPGIYCIGTSKRHNFPLHPSRAAYTLEPVLLWRERREGHVVL